MEYLWLLGWIAGAYLVVGLALFLTWDKQDRQEYPKAKPTRWFEYIIVIVLVSFLWPIAIFTRKYCDGPE